MTAIPDGSALAGYAVLVTQALATQTGLRPDEIDPGLALVAIPGIESVKVLRAVVEIEDAYGIVIPDDFLFETATVADLVAFVVNLAETS
jgi:acyl carrier protein